MDINYINSNEAQKKLLDLNKAIFTNQYDLVDNPRELETKISI